MGYALSVLSNNQVVNYAHAQNMGLEVQFARFPKFPVASMTVSLEKWQTSAHASGAVCWPTSLRNKLQV